MPLAGSWLLWADQEMGNKLSLDLTKIAVLTDNLASTPWSMLMSPHFLTILMALHTMFHGSTGVVAVILLTSTVHVPVANLCQPVSHLRLAFIVL